MKKAASSETEFSFEDDAEDKFSADDLQSIRAIKRKSINSFTSEEIKSTEKWARKFDKELGTKSPFFRAWLGDWRAYEKREIPFVVVNSESINRVEIPRGNFYNNDTSWDIISNSDGIDETSSKEHKWSDSYHALKDIDNMLRNAILLDTVVVTKPSKRLGKDVAFMHHLYCPVIINGQKGIAKLYVSETIGSNHKFYLNRIEKASSDMGFNTEIGISTPRGNATSNDASISISKIFDFVKKNDKIFEKNSEHPVYFNPKPVNPILLNEDGTTNPINQIVVFSPTQIIEPAGGTPDTNVSYGTMPDTDSTISISDLFSLVKQDPTTNQEKASSRHL